MLKVKRLPLTDPEPSGAHKQQMCTLALEGL